MKSSKKNYEYIAHKGNTALDYPTDKTRRELQTNETVEAGLVSQAELREDLVIPVLQEEIEVHKEIRKTGTVRIRKTVRESEELVHESLAYETVDVERVPMDRFVDTLPSIRTEGEVTVIPVVKEEIVVTKRLRLVEELRLTKRVSVSDYSEPVTLRAEEVVIERVDSENLNVQTSKAQG